MKKLLVIIGSYGSGKTELSVNFALAGAKKQRTTLVDMDIVNPYFRSSDKTSMLKEAGVRVLAPNFAGSTVDVPSLPAAIGGVFTDESELVVFDVGGDPVGATTLGAYHTQFSSAKCPVEVLYVINARRPLSATCEAVVELLLETQRRSRLSVTGLVNNANLAVETTLEELKAGYELVREVSLALGLAVKYTTGSAPLLSEFRALNLPEAYTGQLLQIDIFMRPHWLDF